VDVLKGHGFSRAIDPSKTTAALAAEGKPVDIFISFGPKTA
jgi:hypothetical protein